MTKRLVPTASPQGVAEMLYGEHLPTEIGRWARDNRVYLLTSVVQAEQSAGQARLRGAAEAKAQQRLEMVLACLYQRDPRFAAQLCDEELDRSGGLLGRVRQQAAELEKIGIPDVT